MSILTKSSSAGHNYESNILNFGIANLDIIQVLSTRCLAILPSSVRVLPLRSVDYKLYWQRNALEVRIQTLERISVSGRSVETVCTMQIWAVPDGK